MIQVDHIKFDYIRRDGEDNVIAVETAVNDVSFEVKTGEFVAILGHNGSGKSTLARHINALLVPEEGGSSKKSRHASRKKIVPESFVRWTETAGSNCRYSGDASEMYCIRRVDGNA